MGIGSRRRVSAVVHFVGLRKGRLRGSWCAALGSDLCPAFAEEVA